MDQTTVRYCYHDHLCLTLIPFCFLHWNYLHPYFSLWETSQTLFWASFGLIDLDNFELTGIKEFTRFWGLVMFGSFSVINIIVLLNLLIAMMNHSYQLISVSSVRFWKIVSHILNIIAVKEVRTFSNQIIYWFYWMTFDFIFSINWKEDLRSPPPPTSQS